MPDDRHRWDPLIGAPCRASRAAPRSPAARSTPPTSRSPTRPIAFLVTSAIAAAASGLRLGRGARRAGGAGHPDPRERRRRGRAAGAARRRRRDHDHAGRPDLARRPDHRRRGRRDLRGGARGGACGAGRVRRRAASATFDSPGVTEERREPGEHKDFAVGDAHAAMALAPVRIDARYATPTQHHNPIELFTTTAAWHDGSLTVYEPSQFVHGLRGSLAKQLQVPTPASAWSRAMSAARSARRASRPRAPPGSRSRRGGSAGR